jgi:hypothetical protein
MQGEEKPNFYAETASIYLGLFYIKKLNMPTCLRQENHERD